MQMLYQPIELPTQDSSPRLASMTVPQLEAEYRRLIWELYMLDCAPTDVPLPDEWFIARASLEGQAFDVLTEQVVRERWTAKAEPPLPIPEW